MTVMATSGTQKTIDEVCRLAYVLAGLLEETQPLTMVGGGSLARAFLETVVTDLQAMGISARASSFYNLTLTEGTSEYAMPAHVLDVYGDAMYIDASEEDVNAASAETIVIQRSAEQWNDPSAKDATGRPTTYFAYRVETPPSVRLWPIPDEDGTIRFQIHRHLANCSDGSATIDMEIYWTGYFMYAVAALLAESKSMPDVKVHRLERIAAKKLRDARSMSTSRTGSQIRVTHSGGWRR